MPAPAAPVASRREQAVALSEAFEVVPRDAVIAVAMSGGVDSSVAAALCAQSGRRTMGITLAMWPRDQLRDRDRGCCSVDAVEDARRVAARLDIPHYSWNLEADFTREVIDDFSAEYAAGRTPNPCVRCNERIKFGALLDRALAAGATHLATGHWARRGRRGEAATLHRAINADKDQAYALHRLTRAQLSHAVFPLGQLPSKDGLRAIAADLGLVTAAKPESQELCFVDGRVDDDLQRRLAGRFRPGPVLDLAGRRIGEHRGLPFYTVGQRAGLALQARRPDATPLYVTELDVANNSITVGPRGALERSEVAVGSCSWIAAAPELGELLEVQLRSRARPSPVMISRIDDDSVVLGCDPPVTQVAPGQAAVLYTGDEVVGGGLIA